MTTMQIPIAKAGKAVFFSVDSDDLNAVFDANPEVFRDIIERGLKDLLNTRMSKEISAPSKLSGEAFESNKAKALAQAEKNFEDMKAGKLLKKSAAKANAGADRATVTEANRLAKEVVRNAIKAEGGKISHYAPKDITEWAKRLVAEDPSYLADAKANLEARAQVKPKIAIGIKVDPEKVRKAEAEKAAKKTQLSAKQASMTGSKGKVPPRKGQAPSQQHTQH